MIMARLIHKKKSQAILELAICGSLFLFVLGVLVQYGVRLNARQELMMKSYRHALRKASTEGIGDTYLDYSATYIKDIPVPDVSSPYGIGRLSSMRTGSSAKRTYFMMNQEEADPASNPRVHYVINDRERSEYDEAGVDGFVTNALRLGFHFITENSRYVVIRVIPDPEDKLEPYNVYWTWAKICVNKLTPKEDTNNGMTDEEIVNLFDSGNGVSGTIVNLGTNLDFPLNIPIARGDLFVKVLESSIVDAGTRLHSSCLREADDPYKISVVSVQDHGMVHVRGYDWGDTEINPQDVSTTARRIANQGLAREEILETNRNDVRVVNEKTENRFSTRTPTDYQEKVTRTINLNHGDKLHVESIRTINEDKYNWQSQY